MKGNKNIYIHMCVYSQRYPEMIYKELIKEVTERGAV